MAQGKSSWIYGDLETDRNVRLRSSQSRNKISLALYEHAGSQIGPQLPLTIHGKIGLRAAAGKEHASGLFLAIGNGNLVLG